MDIWRPSRMELDRYRRTFFDLDADRDGYVDVNDVQSFLAPALRSEDLERLIHLTDTNEDGILECNEFIALLHLVEKCSKEGQKVPLELPGPLQDIIDDTHTPSDERIVREGPRIPPSDLWVPPAEVLGEADVAFAELDGDNDGFVSREDISRYLHDLGITEEDGMRIFSLADTNEDGIVELPEFRAIIHLARLRVHRGIPIPRHLPEALVRVVEEDPVPKL